MTIGIALGIFALFVVVNLTGPFALYAALRGEVFTASILSAISVLLGLHWYLNILSPPRYLGLFSTLCSAAAVGVMLGRWSLTWLWPPT